MMFAVTPFSPAFANHAAEDIQSAQYKHRRIVKCI